MEKETLMNEFVKSLGLPNWQVVWKPDADQPKLGRIIPENRIILVHDLKAKAAMKTILHEVIELKLRPAFNIERSLSNAIIEWAATQTYREKEKAVEEVLDLLLDLVEKSDDFKDILEEVSAG